jgi:terminase small subunit-like protein
VPSIDSLPAIPRNIKDPPVKADASSPRTLARWTMFLGSVAAGTPVEESMLKHLMTRADIEACLRHDPEERARWNEAKLAAKKKKFHADEIDEILEDIASGTTLTDAVQTVKPGDGRAIRDFLAIVIADPVLNTQYMAALKSRAVLEGEKLFDIADGDGDDFLDNGKGGFVPNNAKVNRDKLRVETRKGLMQSWFPKLFGENKGTQVNVQVNNHAARLEEARTRRDSRSALPPPISREAIEAAFKELPAAPATEKPEWDDLPLDTTWREEA